MKIYALISVIATIILIIIGLKTGVFQKGGNASTILDFLVIVALPIILVNMLPRSKGGDSGGGGDIGGNGGGNGG